MLLFVRKYYVEEIRAGRKPFEIRAGARYRKIQPGDELSINGQFKLTVTRVDAYNCLEEILAALPDWADAIEDCYPGQAGPFYVFHFDKPDTIGQEKKDERIETKHHLRD